MTEFIINRMRRQPLSGLEGHQGERNLWVSAYPISGNSYIAYVLAYILNCKYWDVDDKEWSPQRIPLKKYLDGTNEHPHNGTYDCLLKTHAPPATIPASQEDYLIYIVRNVHDVSNSYFHRVEKTWETSPNWKRRILCKLAKSLIPFRLRYRLAIRYFSRGWASEVQRVLDDGTIPILKYEHFIANPLETLQSIIAELAPGSWDEAVARDALDLFSMKNMKAAAKHAVTDESKRTDRVGGSGDYQKYFSPADIKWFEQQYSEILTEIDSRAQYS